MTDARTDDDLREAEHYRQQARYYLRAFDREQQNNTIMREVLKQIAEQGGDVQETWSSRLAAGVLHQIEEREAEHDGR